jgi:hypothetical protein
MNISQNSVDTARSHHTTPTYLKPLAKDLEDINRCLETAAMERSENPDLLFISSRCFLPRSTIKQITEDFHLVDSMKVLGHRLEGWKYWDEYGPALWAAVDKLRIEMVEILNIRHREKLEKQRESREKKREEQVRAELASAGLANVKRVRLVLPNIESDSVAPLPLSTTGNSTATSTVKISDIGNHSSPLFEASVEPSSFYPTQPSSQKRGRPVLQPNNMQSHNDGIRNKRAGVNKSSIPVSCAVFFIIIECAHFLHFLQTSQGSLVSAVSYFHFECA